MKLFPVIVQDAMTKDVLMLAYANKEAIRKTRQTGFAWFYSRSRQKLWKKGETSGNTLKIKNISWDCDKDALLYTVVPTGSTCHTGEETCFGPKTFSLERLQQILEVKTNVPDSYTATLLDEPWLLAEKLAEEGAELGETENKRETIWEAADVLYFALVKLTQQQIDFNVVLSELKRRNMRK